MFYIRLNTKKKCASPNKYKGFSTFIPTTGIFMMIHDVKTETKRNKILISDIFNMMKKRTASDRRRPKFRDLHIFHIRCKNRCKSITWKFHICFYSFVKTTYKWIIYVLVDCYASNFMSKVLVRFFFCRFRLM